MTDTPLQILAGAEAFARIQAEGFHPGLFNSLLGASGGPKWFVLSRLDRILAASFFGNRDHPIACMGSSIGSWRHACYAQRDPVAALARLEQTYIQQRYTPKPDRYEVSRVARQSVDCILGAHGAREIVDNPVWQTHILAVRSRPAVSTDSSIPLALGLGASALGNALSRRSLGGFFSRALFYSGNMPAFAFSEFQPSTVGLTPENVRQAILASGSIPLVMEGVSDIPGAPPGVYRDGGITDYHFDFTFKYPEGLLLYPHFYGHVTPGWYDKPWRRRRVSGTALSRTVLLAPAPEFVAKLPYGKIPDRGDFKTLSADERIRYWTEVCEESQRLADAFFDAWQNDSIQHLIQPL
jgi:hypothetical protein